MIRRWNTVGDYLDSRLRGAGDTDASDPHNPLSERLRDQHIPNVFVKHVTRELREDTAP
jgi:hypothetical protein